jgi:large subunit ribosomal protein L10
VGDPNPEKVAIVAEVQEKFSNADAVVLTEYRGLNVTDMAVLREAMREAGGEYKVYKNTLVRFAAKELNLEIEELLVGPTAIAFTGTRPDGSPGDPVTIAKALTDFSKKNENLVIKGGMLDGGLLTTDEIIALSKIAPRDELLARLAGGIAAPLQQFASLLNAVPQKFAFALSALIEASGGTPEEKPVAEEETAEAEVAEEETAEAEVAEEETAEAEVAEEETAEAEVAEEETAEAEVAEEETAEAEEVEDSEKESTDNEKIDGEAKENEES